MNKDIIRFLSEGRAKFSYTTVNGENREATGTTNVDLIPESDRPKTENANSETGETITYYDLDKNGWRSFRSENLKDESVTSVAS